MWISELIRMPFGSVGSVHAFHRVANVLVATMRQLLYILGGKYVDDFFGMTKKGQNISGATMLETLAAALGFPVDKRKSSYFEERMSILGCCVTLSWLRWSINVSMIRKRNSDGSLICGR